jgi:hypothetical protein
MCDIMLDEPVKVRSGEQISIGVRFTVGEEFYCGTVFGYGGSNYERKIGDNERGAFIIADSDQSTKGETEVEYGQIPKIHYF